MRLYHRTQRHRIFTPVLAFFTGQIRDIQEHPSQLRTDALSPGPVRTNRKATLRVAVLLAHNRPLLAIAGASVNYGTVTVITTGDGFTVLVPVADTVTLYVRVDGVELPPPPPPQAIMNPSVDIANPVSSTASARLRRTVNGASSTPNITMPPVFHGSAGA